ncbi:MAG TPA: hypothetical protein VG649_10375 [Candidatus Angelobacter sp.]|jgi:hypothetical protein|nr:hypothetical protein [Candidatus Angelobacter sp.]
MSGAKKRVIRPNLGSALRPKTNAPRKHFLTVDLTKEEHQQILQRCLAHGISLSQFFADLVLADATNSKPERKQKMVVKFELELTADEYDKLEMLARVHEKSDLNELVYDLLMPNLELERLHSPMDPITVRYYLSKEEHDIVTRHVASKGFSACNYTAMLARKAVLQNKKRK